MPEGDSILRLANTLAPILEGREVTAFTARRLTNDAARSIIGHHIVSVIAKGKNLLIRFDDERVIHIHLRMNGRVFVERPRSAFWTPPRTQADMRLVVAGASVVGMHLPLLRLLTAAQERRSPDLAGLGPDLVREGWNEAEAIRRFRTLTDREIGDALLVQRAAAGIGNVYKSEVLFLEGMDPRSLVSSITEDELRLLLRRASVLLRRNLHDGPRTTHPTLGNAPRLWVYGRHRRPCLRCQTPIVRFMQGPTPGRPTYQCRSCQPSRARSSRGGRP